jgi:hypothetical protein
MVNYLFSAHPFLAYTVGACFLLLSGYGQARLFHDNPIGACSSWFLAALWSAFGLATIKFLWPLGPFLALVVFVGSLIWIVRYYNRHLSQ